MTKQTVDDYFDAHIETLIDRYEWMQRSLKKILEQVDNDIKLIKLGEKLIKERQVTKDITNWMPLPDLPEEK